MFALPFLYSAFPGQLPVNAHLEVENILFSADATALKVMCFDMDLNVATSYNPSASSGGYGTSAWAYVDNYEVNTATMDRSARDIYCVAKAAYSSGKRGAVIVIGAISGLPKVGSAAHALGQPLAPSMASIGTVAPAAAIPTTLVATAALRKYVALCTNAATATSANVHFNGFGWGWCFKNVAYNAD